MRKSVLLSGVVLFTVTSATWYYFAHKDRAATAALAQEGTAPALSSKVEEKRRKKVVEIRQAFADRSHASSSAQEELAASLPEIWKLHLSINRKQSYRELAEEFGQNLLMIEEFKSIILQIDRTKGVYGDLQAQARIVAIDMLAEIARSGQEEPLMDVLASLNKQKTEQPDYDQRQETDRLDLLRAYIDAKGPTLLDDMESFLTATAFTPALAEDYYNLMWVWLRNKMDQNLLKTKLAYFDKFLPAQ